MDKRIFVKKKDPFTVEQESLRRELEESLGIELESLELYNGYDVFGATKEDLDILKYDVLSEKVTDDVYEDLDLSEGFSLAVEYLPGQYDQRADSASQCLMLLNGKETVEVKSFQLYVFPDLPKEVQDRIRKYLINPVESREKDLSQMVETHTPETGEVPFYEGFTQYDEKELKDFAQEKGLAMSYDDLVCIQDYFRDEEGRDPSETEIRVLDTYWSDHCRHTTFETVLTDIRVQEGELKEALEQALVDYLALRKTAGREDRPQTLMDMATVFGKSERVQGRLQDHEVSEEINACSVFVNVKVEGEDQKWLMMFKNETHNHPTEIEPFGGASTCIGGAIRDPLSGRSYVYQAMRITGAADITRPYQETMKNKLPQSKISKGAAEGYSSYGNQIGLATTFVRELYHENYVAKRLEVGAVIGAAPAENVVRSTPKPGDVIVLLGGATGRDGIGGATGSSKSHTDQSLSTCSSEVQKGNAPIERKIQRLFRDPEVTKKIIRCNDFGAGGVSVAIGELAEGLVIDLDAVPLKYEGLSGTEIAISESQERMAVVIHPEDFPFFQKKAYGENLSAHIVAEVTEEKRLVMKHDEKTIVNLSRAFLDTNGAKSYQDVEIETSLDGNNPFEVFQPKTKEEMVEILGRPNVAMQKGLIEMFDASIGRSTVLMPFGGKTQLSEQDASVQKFPTRKETSTASMMAYGFHPYLSEYSPFLGAQYSVAEALSRIVACGGDWSGCRLTNQEYFERLREDPLRWGKPAQALLGLLEAQKAFGTPSIGGKDSMSGTFEDIDVPPTLITFAVTTQEVSNIHSNEFKGDGYLYYVKHDRLEHDLPNYQQLKDNWNSILEEMKAGNVLAASALRFGGLLEVLTKMSLGNEIGMEVETDECLADPNIGSLVVETKEPVERAGWIALGKTGEGPVVINGVSFSQEELRHALMERYEHIYPTATSRDKGPVDIPEQERSLHIPKRSQPLTSPRVLVPVFPGSNCEYDTRKAFEKYGGNVEIFVFNNLNVHAIDESLRTLEEKLDHANILSLVGGFSMGDEPDGSGKFIANVLRNARINEAIQRLLDRDGLILGICNGFQALIKSGLLPYGDITKLNENSPTLFRNDINRHISRMADTKIINNESPWLSGFDKEDIFTIPLSHGEGKFTCSLECAQELFEAGQVATVYTDPEGRPTMDGRYNPNGSVLAIEGITSPDGKILGKMGHSERFEEGLFQNIPGEKEQNIFKNGIEFFTK